MPDLLTPTPHQLRRTELNSLTKTIRLHRAAPETQQFLKLLKLHLEAAQEMTLGDSMLQVKRAQGSARTLRELIAIIE